MNDSFLLEMQSRKNIQQTAKPLCRAQIQVLLEIINKQKPTSQESVKPFASSHPSTQGGKTMPSGIQPATKALQATIVFLNI